jgi:hypothetical protein
MLRTGGIFALIIVLSATLPTAAQPKRTCFKCDFKMTCQKGTMTRNDKKSETICTMGTKPKTGTKKSVGWGPSLRDMVCTETITCTPK